MKIGTVYLASPLGFSPELKGYRERIKNHLNRIEIKYFDPWDLDFENDVLRAKNENSARTSREVAKLIGRANTKLIEQSDAVLAVLDGMEPDSGTVAELAYAAGRGKRAYGLRTDFRNAGELPNLPINMQVYYFITLSKGKLFSAISDIQF